MLDNLKWFVDRFNRCEPFLWDVHSTLNSDTLVVEVDQFQGEVVDPTVNVIGSDEDWRSYRTYIDEDDEYFGIHLGEQLTKLTLYSYVNPVMYLNGDQWFMADLPEDVDIRALAEEVRDSGGGYGVIHPIASSF